MRKGALGHAADLAQMGKAIMDIIRAGLKGGWAGAAMAAMKAFWPKLLPIALALIFLPVIIMSCLPAILFGVDGTPEQSQADEYMACYQNYVAYRDEQLVEVRDQMDTLYEIEYVNDPFDINWLIAIDSVKNENDLNRMTEQGLKELIKMTYTYEVVDADPEETETEPQGSSESEAAGTMETESASQSPPPSKVIRVTTLSPDEVMKSLDFDEDHINWATLIYSTYSDS